MKNKPNPPQASAAKKTVQTSAGPAKIFVALVLVLLALTCFAYWTHFNNPFQYDDGFIITNNYYIRDLHNIGLFFTDVKTSCAYAPNQVYRPVHTTLNAIVCWIGGKGVPVPFYYHCSVFICFIILGIFIYLFAIKIYNISFKHRLNRYIALLTAAVFMLNTANAETVNYIYVYSDLFSALMVVICLCVFAYYKNLRKYQLYLIPLLIGLLTKEPAVMAAPLAFLYLFLFEENLGLNKLWSSASFKILWRTGPAFILAVVVFLLAQSFSPARWGNGSYFNGHFSFTANVLPYLLTQSLAIVHYINSYIFPFGLSVDPDWALIGNPFDEKIVLSTAFILFTLYLAYKASLQDKSRPVTYGILWFYLALMPTSSIFPLPEVMIDHRAFFAYIGLTIAIVWALFLLYTKYETTLNRRPVLSSGLVLLICIFFMAHVYGVRQRNEVWSSEENLWQDAVNKNPKNGRALMYVGKIRMAKGDYTNAQDYLTRAKQAWPNYQYIYINLGVLYNALGKYQDAEQNFKYALQLDPENADCYSYYASALLANGHAAGAKELIEKGLKFNPGREELLKLKNQLATPGSTKSKLETLQDIVKSQPTAENWMSLSVEYYMNNRFEDCIFAAEQSLKLHPDYDIAYNNICTANNALHQWDKAIEAGKKAVFLSPGAELFKNNLKIAEDGKKNAK